MITRQVMKEELTYECNYTHEAYMRSSEVRRGSAATHDLKLTGHEKGSADRVPVMEHVCGSSVGDDAILRLPQAGCNEVRPFPPPQPRGSAQAARS